MLIGIVGLIVPVAIVAGVIAAIVALVRRGRGDSRPGIGSLKRLYFYGLSLAGLVATGIGIVLLGTVVLDSLFGPVVITVSHTPLALGLALTVAGGPVWFLFWSLAQRSVRQFPAEVESFARKAYIYLVLAGSAIMASIGAITFVRWLLGSGGFDGTPVALAITWGGVWAYHWILERREGLAGDLARSTRRAYVYGLSLFALVVMALGVGTLLHAMLLEAYRTLFDLPSLLVVRNSGLWTDATRTSVAMNAVGGVLWWWHWHRLAAQDFESDLRRLYLYLFAILGAASTVVASLSVVLFHVLQWLLGTSVETGAALHFSGLPAQIASTTVGAGIWGYHWATMQQEAPQAGREPGAARRVYNYLVSAVGLVAMGVGLAVLFATAIGLVADPGIAQVSGPEWWEAPLALAITLLLVGGIVWGLYWRNVQRIVTRGGPEERLALSRRTFIYLVFGGSALLALVNLSIVLFRLFDAILGGQIPSDMLWQVRWSIGMLLTASAAASYYWLVLREDRGAAPAFEQPVPAPAPTAEGAAARRVQLTALVPEAALPLVEQLEQRLGQSIRVWRRTGVVAVPPEVTDDRLADLERRIAACDSAKVLLLVDGRDIQVMPYKE